MNRKIFAYLPFMVLAVAAVIAAFHIKLYW
jgi:hypothetical protein